MLEFGVQGLEMGNLGDPYLGFFCIRVLACFRLWLLLIGVVLRPASVWGLGEMLGIRIWFHRFWDWVGLEWIGAVGAV